MDVSVVKSSPAPPGVSNVYPPVVYDLAVTIPTQRHVTGSKTSVRADGNENAVLHLAGIGNGNGEIALRIDERIDRPEALEGADVRVVPIAVEPEKTVLNIGVTAEDGIVAIAAAIDKVLEVVQDHQAIIEIRLDHTPSTTQRQDQKRHRNIQFSIHRNLLQK